MFEQKDSDFSHLVSEQNDGDGYAAPSSLYPNAKPSKLDVIAKEKAETDMRMGGAILYPTSIKTDWKKSRAKASLTNMKMPTNSFSEKKSTPIIGLGILYLIFS